MPRKGLNFDRIVEATAELIEDKGYEQLSLHDLAAKLDIKPASLYNHMKSLAELNYGLGEYAQKRLNEELYEGLSRQKHITLTAIADIYRKFALDNPELYKTFNKFKPAKEGDQMNDSRDFLYGLYEALEDYDLNREETIHFNRAFRSAMHGFVSFETAGFFGNAVSAEESYHDMINSVIESIEPKRKK